MNYIVIEIQTYADGTTGILSDSYSELTAAWQKYYTVLAAAAVSSVTVHTALIMSNDGRPIESKCFKHGTEEER